MASIKFKLSLKAEPLYTCSAVVPGWRFLPAASGSLGRQEGGQSWLGWRAEVLHQHDTIHYTNTTLTLLQHYTNYTPTILQHYPNTTPTLNCNKNRQQKASLLFAHRLRLPLLPGLPQGERDSRWNSRETAPVLTWDNGVRQCWS